VDVGPGQEDAASEVVDMELTSAPVTTMLPITDPLRARAFYEERLGLPFAGADAEGKLIFDLAGGAKLALTQRPEGVQAAHTVMSFEVTDIGASIRELEQGGVTFQDYDLPGLRTVEHVCVLGSEKAAWFEDPDHNILCLHEAGPATAG
jgi:catechol 2,3-dioxygenase-like lactoylglutathione lyase family enzyme